MIPCAILIAGFVLMAGSVWAQAIGQETGRVTGILPASGVSPGQIWTFFFLLLGPVKIVAPFAGITRGHDTLFVRRLAFRSTICACAVLGVAALVGVPMLDNFNIAPAVLALAGGIVVFLVALRALLDQIAGAANVPVPPAKEATLSAAFSPLAFPVIVTPAGIAAVIVFMALAADTSAKLVIASLAVFMLVLDLCAMLFARVIVRWAAMPLQVFGAVVGIIQLALGLHVILIALNTLTVITYHNG